MPTDFWFRLSTYLSLALACVCLGYAEWQFLPEVTGFTALVVVLLAVSFALDRRFELSLAKANALGLGIGAVAVVWIAWHLTNPAKSGPLAEIEFPTNMLPLIAPVLMALVPAKLFRPKHVGDWWAMHGVAVAAVALAASMTDDAPFVVLFAAYGVCSAWALVLFFYRRSGGFIPPIPNAHRTPPPQAQLAPADPDARPPKWVFARTLVWLAASAVVAVALFVSLPRSAGYVWVFSKKYYVTGETNDSKLVVSKSGELTESDEVAFKVRVTDAEGKPKTDLDPDQHWRTREFVAYMSDDTKREAAWAAQPTDFAYLWVGALGGTAAKDFGADGYALRYELADGKLPPPVAVPVRWVDNRAPVQNDGGKPLAVRGNANILFQPRPERYTQASGPADPPDLGSRFEMRDPTGVNPLRRNGPEFFREYARGLLARLIAAGQVDPAAKLNSRDQVPEEWHEQVGRAFAAHFRDSNEFTYTTTLEPADRKLDPLVDFVKNTKAGHCEWFAGALVLTLRAVGIPAQLVTGYRGWDLDEDGETLLVRQRHAHAWVEALVSRPTPPDFKFRPQTPPELHGRVWHWLTLDPTTGSSAGVAQQKNWLEQGANWITNFLLRFDKAKQEKAVEEVRQAGTTWWPWATGGLAAAVGGWVGWRWVRRRAAGRVTFDGPDWFARFQAALAARGFTRAGGQTPREFADAAAAALPQAADVIQFVTSKLYRVRYAGMPLKPDEEQQVTAAIEQLEQKLATTSPPTGAP